MSSIDLGSLEYDFLLNLSPFELAARKAQRQLEQLDADTQRRLDTLQRRSQITADRMEALDVAAGNRSRQAFLAIEQLKVQARAQEMVADRLRERSAKLRDESMKLESQALDSLKKTDMATRHTTQQLRDMAKAVPEIAEANKKWAESMAQAKLAADRLALTQDKLTLAVEKADDAMVAGSLSLRQAREADMQVAEAMTVAEERQAARRIAVIESVAAAQRRQAEQTKRVEDAALARLEAQRRQRLAALTTVSRDMMVVGGVGIAGMGMAARAAGDWQAELARAQALTDDTALQNRQAGRFARGLGNRTGIPAEEIIQEYTQLRQLGKTGQEAFNEISHATDAAVARNEKLANVISAVDGLMRAFNLDSRESGHVTDILTKATEHTGLTMQQLETNLQAARVAAANMHISVQELVASFIQMIHHGSSATSVGNVFAQTMTRLSIPHPRLIAEAKALGVEWVANGHVIEHFAKVGYPTAIGELIRATKDSPALIEQLMGVRQGSGRSANMLTLFEGPVDGLKRITDQMMVTAGESKRTANIAIGTWNRQVDLLKENFRDFQRGIGAGLIGTLNGFLTWTNHTAEAFNKLDDGTKKVIGVATGAFSGILGIGGASLWLVIQIAKARAALAALGLWKSTEVVAEVEAVSAAVGTAEGASAATVAAGGTAGGALIAGTGLVGAILLAGAAFVGLASTMAHYKLSILDTLKLIGNGIKDNITDALGYTNTGVPGARMIPVPLPGGGTTQVGDSGVYILPGGTTDRGRFALPTAPGMKSWLGAFPHVGGFSPLRTISAAEAAAHRGTGPEQPLYARGIGTLPSQVPSGKTRVGSGIGNRLDTGVAALDAQIMAARSILDPTERIDKVTELEEKRVHLLADLHIKQLHKLEAAGKATADATNALISQTNASVTTQIAALETVKKNTLEKIQGKAAAKWQREDDRFKGKDLSGLTSFYAARDKGLDIQAPSFLDAANPLDYASAVGMSAYYESQEARTRYRQNLLTLPLNQRQNENDPIVRQFAATRDARIEAAENKRAERIQKLEDKQTELDERQQAALMKQIDKAIQTNEYQLRFAPGLTPEQRVARHGQFIQSQIGATYTDPLTHQKVGLKSQDDIDRLTSQAQEETDRAAEMVRKKFVAAGIANARAKGKVFTGDKDRSQGSAAIADALLAMLSDPAYAGKLDDDDIAAIRDEASRYADQAASEKTAYEQARSAYIEGRQSDDLLLQARSAGGRSGSGFFRAGKIDPNNVVAAAQLVQEAQKKAEEDKKYGYSSPAYFNDIRKQVDSLLKPTSIWEGLKDDADKKFKSISDSFAKAVGEMAVHGGNFKKWFQSVWEDIVSWFTEFVVQKLLAGIASIFTAGKGAKGGGGLMGAIQAAAGALPGGSGGGSGLLGSLSAAAGLAQAFAPHAMATAAGQVPDLSQAFGPGTPTQAAGGAGGLASAMSVGGALKGVGWLGKSGIGGMLSKALPWLGLAGIALPLLGGLFHRHHKRLLFDDSGNDWQAGLSGRDFTTHFLAGVSKELSAQTAAVMAPQMPRNMRAMMLGERLNARQMAFNANQGHSSFTFNMNQPTLLDRRMVSQLTDHVDRALASKLIQRSGRGSFGGRDRQT